MWQLTAGSAVFGLVLAAGAVALAGPWDSGQRKAEREWAAAQVPTGGAHHDGERVRVPASAPSAAGVLAELGVSAASLSAPADLPGDLTKTLGPLLESPDLGPAPAASVVDVATGEQLFGQRADRPMAPASTIKIATAIAALSALGPDHRIPTTVVTADGGRGDDDKPGDTPAGESDGKPGNEADGKGEDPTEITLVGGGDATLDRAGLRSSPPAPPGRCATAVCTG